MTPATKWAVVSVVKNHRPGERADSTTPEGLNLTVIGASSRTPYKGLAIYSTYDEAIQRCVNMVGEYGTDTNTYVVVEFEDPIYHDTSFF